MASPLALVHPVAISVGGVKLIGLTSDVGKKIAYTVALLVALYLVRRMFLTAFRAVWRGHENVRPRFWARQGSGLAVAVMFVVGVFSIWLTTTNGLGVGLGLVSAGVAFAMQKVITSFAGYFVILRGDVFSVGDRVEMGGVRGDVIALGFVRTTILEMGSPPQTTSDDQLPHWIRGRQATGRIVTVTNDNIFNEPVYNYTHGFPYIWEELWFPVPYDCDRMMAEQILLDVAKEHTVRLSQMSHEALVQMRKRYLVPPTELEPKVYWRITDNWLELTVRFVARAHGIRELKSDMTRDVVERMDDAGIRVASATYEVVGIPELTVKSGQRSRSTNGRATKKAAH